MGCIFKPKGTKYFYVKYYRNGKPYIESSKSVIKADAKRILALREGQIQEGRFHGLKVLKTSISDLLKLIIRKSEEDKLPSLTDRRHYVKLLEEHFGATKAANLATAQVMDYRKKRREQGVSDQTINRELGVLRRAYNLAMEHDPPLVQRVPKISLTSEKECIRKGFIEDEEFRALRGVLPEHLKIAITIGYYTGMRSGEILGLQWRQVDFKQNTLRLDPGTTKNKEGRVAPMISEMRDVLERWWMESMTKYPDCPWVIHRNSERITRHFGKAWKTACKKVGLEGLLFHDLRRSAIRNLIRAGVPQSIAMAISGHKTDSVFRRYDIVSELDIAEAGNKLSQYLNSRRAMEEAMVKKQLKLASESRSGLSDGV